MSKKVIIDGVEYIPKVEVQPLIDERLLNCLHELINIQYFYESSHKHRAWAWDAMDAIAPEVAEMCGNSVDEAKEWIDARLKEHKDDE